MRKTTTPATTDRAARLSNASRWLEHFQDEDHLDELDVVLIDFIKAYRKDLIHATGIADEYGHDMERRDVLVDAVRSTRPIYESVSELRRETKRMPSEAWMLLSFLNAATLELVCTIRKIEAEHPSLAALFASEREIYAASLLQDT